MTKRLRVAGMVGLAALLLAPGALVPCGADALSDGIALLRAKQPEKACAALVEVVRQRPGDAAALYWLGRAQLAAGREEDAVSALAQAVAAKPTSVDSRVWLGSAQLSLGHWAAARVEFEAVLGLVPGHAGARDGLRQADAEAQRAALVYGSRTIGASGAARVAFAPGGLGIDVGTIDLLTSNVYDYTFSDAPADWFARSGLWTITNRWTCSPQWSWQGGFAQNGTAALWNKRQFTGNVTVESYLAFKMGLGTNFSYENPCDMNLTLCGDGANPDSGYAFMIGAERNTETRIMKGSQVLATTSRPEALLPVFEDAYPSTYDFHRRWWSVRARKLGAKLQLYLDERLVLEAEDTDPLRTGHVGIWTCNNGLIVSRTKIYFEREEPLRADVPGEDRLGPLAPAGPAPALELTSETHPSVQQDFEQGIAPVAARADQDPVRLGLATPGADGTGRCLAVTNTVPGGTFGARLVAGPVVVQRTPCLSFDYRLPADQSVKVNLYLTAADRMYEIVFSGPPTGAPVAQRLGAIQAVQADGQWHRATFDLMGALRGALGPVQATKISDLWIGNLNEEGYLLAGFGGNRLGATYWLDNLCLDRPGTTALKLKAAPRVASDAGCTYAWAVDGSAATAVPDDAPFGALPESLAAPGEGTWFAHVRLRNADGALSETEHFRFRTDQTPPCVIHADPTPGSAVPDGPISLQLAEPGDGGVVLDTLDVKANGNPLPLDGRAVSYDASTGVLAVDPRAMAAPLADGAELVLVVSGLSDAAGNVGAGPTELRYRVDRASDRTAPRLDALRLNAAAEAPADNDFERSVGDFAGYGGAGAADISLDAATAASGRSSLRVHNRASGGRFGLNVTRRPFDAGVFRAVSFDYNIPERLRAELAVYVNGSWKAIHFTDNDCNLTRVGAVPDVRADGGWHHAEIDLYDMLRRDDPTAPGYIVRQFVISDWNWTANARGQTYHLDNFAFTPVVSSADGLKVSWSAADVSGIRGVDWSFSAASDTPLHQEIRLDGLSGVLDGLSDCTGWLRASACDGAGNWGPAGSWRVLADSAAPTAQVISPAEGEHAATSQARLYLVDEGLAGVDPRSIAVQVGGADYSLENGGLSYNSSTGDLIWDCEKVTPEPVVFEDGRTVTVKLAKASDYAGNALAAGPGWQWVMDYSMDTDGPPMQRLQSSSHPTALTNTFEDGQDGWANLGGASGARVELDRSTAASGGASVKLTQQQSGGHMGAYVTRVPFAADTYPTLAFDYRMASDVKLNFVVRMANGTEYPIALTDNPTGAIGRVAGVRPDGTWHHASVDLLALLRQKQPQGSLDVASICVIDRNTMENRVGASAWFDNVTIGKVGTSAPAFRWRATDATGVPGYSFVLDREPATVPDTTVDGAETSKAFGRVDKGRWYLHIRARDGAGNWGPASHYAIMHLTAD